MKNNVLLPLDRMARYYSFLENYDYLIFYADSFEDNYEKKGLTLDNLSEKLSIPQDTILDDFITIINSGMGTINVGGAESDEYYDINDENTKKAILAGRLGFSFVQTSKSFLHLDNIESEALEAFLSESKNKLNKDSDLIFKEGISFKHYKTLFEDNLSEIVENISSNSYMNFSYLHKGKVKKYKNIYPIKIMYDTEENLYAILCIYNNEPHFFRIDLIVDNVEVAEKRRKSKADISEKEKALLKIAPYVWGFKCRDEDKLGKVKIAFKNDGNVWDKVKQDVEQRPGKIYVQNGYLIYEDIVYGKEKFKRWIMGFGSSAIVDRPVKLRNEILSCMRDRQSKLEIVNNNKN